MTMTAPNGLSTALAPRADYLIWKSRCVAHYDKDAIHYDNEFLVKLLKQPELRAFRSLLPVTPASAAALDFGCGTGRQTFELAARGWQVDAFDAAAGMQGAIQRKLDRHGPEFKSKVRLLAGENEIGQSAYLFVSAIGLMDYYPQPILLLERIVRPLAPGGYLMVSFPDRVSPMAWLYATGSFFVCRAFLHTGSAVRRTAEGLGLRFVAQCRSPVNSTFGGMLSFMLFRRPAGDKARELTDPADAIPASPSPQTNATHGGIATA